METLLNPFSLTVGLSGLIFLISGYVLKRRPPREINWFYGYRTSASMRSQERWDFAQRESAVAGMQVGGAMVILSLPAMWFWPPSFLQLYLGILVLVLGVVYLFWKVQTGLRKRFGP
ncbi:SdpI family protein [Robiginitalea sediminis]|uniref:SdpI family protein n=1 Tax=Robiginitalea sediminis TaxID=1982593 RepID=UPI001302EFDB|nr:SdpI family protein [Robiginitalea sediminis]